jgi:hypothetical protein
MQRSRDALGLLAGLMLIVSSGAHSILGWRGLHGELAAAHVPADLVLGLQIGWQFGGAAMLMLGVVLFVMFRQRLRGTNTPLLLAKAVAVTYLGFGAWALGASGGELFFLVFLIPGAFLAMASLYRTQPSN